LKGKLLLDGALTDSFVRQRLLFAGNETSYLLSQLASIAKPAQLRALLTSLARLCYTAGSGAPPGTAYFQHTQWDLEGMENGVGKAGPVDSRRLANEILFGLRAVSTPSGRLGRGGRSRRLSGKP
jgi:hypothetical protein